VYKQKQRVYPKSEKNQKGYI